jgi:hypothetical protein
MGLLSKLFGTPGNLGSVVDSVAGGIRSVKNTFAGKLDVETQASLDQELARIQNEVNKAEAGHPSMFVAGWRPAVGWVCALALFYHFLVAPLVGGFATIDMPTVELGPLLTILSGMLGLSVIRTVEKAKKLEGRH